MNKLNRIIQSDVESEPDQGHCTICSSWEEVSTFGACQHHICFGCIRDHLKSQFISKKKKKGGKIQNFKCPVPSCKTKLNEYNLLEKFVEKSEEVQKRTSCTKCQKNKNYTCIECYLGEMEQLTKANFFRKRIKFEDLLIPYMDQQQQQSFQRTLESQDLICPICRDFMQHPHIICPIGHEMCHICVFQMKENEVETCPLCKEQLLEIAPEVQRTKHLIQKLQIPCPKCNQSIQYNEFITKHQQACLEVFKDCNDCGTSIQSRFLTEHKLNFCIARPCPFECGKRMGEHDNFIMDHLISTIRKNEPTQDLITRLKVVDLFLFKGLFSECPSCEENFLWTVRVNGQNTDFCFFCFKT